MSPRPRKVSDADVFEATLRAMGRLGPGELTLGEIAAEAGVTAGALVQRFGSKRELLLALARRAADGNGGVLAGLRATHRSPLATLREYAACMAHLASSPAALARNLAWLQIDLADEDFRTHLAAQARETRTGLQSLLHEARDARELAAHADPRSLARTLEVVLNGALFTWAFHQEGTAERWIRANVDAVLKPYLATARASGGTARPRRKPR